MECLKALKEFKNEKSPGTDGLQAEFYKHFWKELHVVCMYVCKSLFIHGKSSVKLKLKTKTNYNCFT